MAPFQKELRVALLAAQRAAILTRRVFQQTAKNALAKDDRSPVTIGDFGSQALIISAIKHNFPDDMIVGEEDAAALRAPDGSLLRDRIWDLVRTTHLQNFAAEQELGGGIDSSDAMLDLLDLGRGTGGEGTRFWTVDPIDGTKGFLRGGQYAVCVGLVVNGEATLGVLACPNLPVDNTAPLDSTVGTQPSSSTGLGVLFSAVTGYGATSRPLREDTIDEGDPIRVHAIDTTTEACLCESFDPGHSNHEIQAQIADRLGIVRPSVRMDSQAKYASIARGAAEIYIALPRETSYKFKVWDHVPGEVIVREAGGVVTDFSGQRLDFNSGRSMTANVGVIAAPASLHQQVLDAAKAVFAKQ
jgi:3'(2'), 5'-bisphosphate nucleotidase